MLFSLEGVSLFSAWDNLLRCVHSGILVTFSILEVKMKILHGILSVWVCRLTFIRYMKSFSMWNVGLLYRISCQRWCVLSLMVWCAYQFYVSMFQKRFFINICHMKLWWTSDFHVFSWCYSYFGVFTCKILHFQLLIIAPFFLVSCQPSLTCLHLAWRIGLFWQA